MTDSAQCDTYPENEGSGDEEQQPIGKRERHYIEHRSTQIDDEHLPQQNETDYQEETTTTMEARPHLGRGEAAGVEQIPELEQNEEGEKDAQLIVR
mgnify:CR=1 FL=1